MVVQNGALITGTQWPEGMCPDMHAWEEKWYLHTSMERSVPGYGSVFAQNATFPAHIPVWLGDSFG